MYGPGLENKALARQLRSLENTLKDLEDHIVTNPLSSSSNSQLQDILRSSRFILGYMESLVQSFESLTIAERKAWDDPKSKEQRSLQNAKEQLDAIDASAESFYS